MVRIRLFEERVARLVEGSEIRTPCHLYIGQEAIAAGVCAALDARDYVWGGHRSHGHYLAKGGDLSAMMAEIFGRTTGCSGGRGGSMHLVAPEVGILGTVPLVAATIPLAVGAAMAAKLRSDRRVSVAFFGDGATEEGHFHESLNLVSLYRLPAIFVCENNFYASHMGLFERRVADNIVSAADTAGAVGCRLDGNDVEAVFAAARDAVERARSGGGPTLLECRTYRWRGHVGPSWDMDVGVQRKDELPEWLPKDPIARTRRRLLDAGLSEDECQALEREAAREIETAVAFARQSPVPSEDEITKHVWASTDSRIGP
jgi:acetoin:2,6-dichlorophenolindophenol oxidoreductase subunit alpha